MWKKCLELLKNVYLLKKVLKLFSLTTLSIAMICGTGIRHVTIEQWQNDTEGGKLIY